MNKEKDTSAKMIKIINLTEEDLQGINFIKSITGVATSSKAALEAINSYEYQYKEIARLEKLVSELETWKSQTTIKVGDFLHSFDALQGIIKTKK